MTAMQMNTPDYDGPTEFKSLSRSVLDAIGSEIGRTADKRVEKMLLDLNARMEQPDTALMTSVISVINNLSMADVVNEPIAHALLEMHDASPDVVSFDRLQRIGRKWSRTTPPIMQDELRGLGLS